MTIGKALMVLSCAWVIAAPGTVFDPDGQGGPLPDQVVQADDDGVPGPGGEVAGNVIATDFRGRKMAYDDELLDKHFVAGDGRVNENIGLTTVHHVFHSEHNRLVDHTQDVTIATGDLAFVNQWLDTAITQAQLNTINALPIVTAAQQAAKAAAIDALDWNGERIFQAAKFGTEMQYQHLVFEEFARKVQPQTNIFAGYDITIDPKIVAEFAHAVYRFGHSQLRENVDLVDVNGVATDVGLIEAFLNPVLFNTTGGIGAESADIAAGAIVRGMSRQVGSHIDEFVTGALRNNLLGLPLDLAAINIARARETGVPTLNEFRTQMHTLTGDPKLDPYTSWVDFAAHAKHELSVVNFIAAYGTHSAITGATTLADKRAAALELVLGVDATGAATTLVGRDDFLNATGAFAGGSLGGLNNVDLWIGGLAEAIEPFGGLLGSTFNFVFEIQMEKLQDGDRFYYLTRTAGLNFLTQLEGNSFASLIQRNTDLNLNESDINHFSTHLPADIFSTPAYILEAHVALQQDFDPTQSEAQSPIILGTPGGDLGRDPIGGGIFRPLVIRRDADGDGNAEYLEYTGVDHVVLGGTNRNDHLKSGIGDDTLSGDGGNDRLEGGDGADTLIGGTGDDILIDVGGVGDNLKGGDGNDVLISGSGEALLLAGSGKDYVLGGQDLKETFGGDGDDFVSAGDSSNIVFGGEGNDWVEGGAQADLLQGDNGAPFQDSAIIGNDVILGGGGNDDYDAESGDDILVADTGITRHEGMLGFDWVTHKDDPFAADTDLFFTGALLPSIANNRDRFDQVEGISGWQFNDTLRGDNADVAGGLLLGHELTNFDLITGLRGGTNALFATGTTVFTGGNIILGGGGSDVMEGRGGNDIIDGDRWLNVRIEVRQGTTVGTTDSITGIVSGGQFNGQRLNMLMENGLVNPGNLHIVREILDAGPAGIDTAEFSGNIADYTITGPNAQGFRTVTHNNGGADGVDLVRNVEVLQFADGRILSAGINNTAATGEMGLVGAPGVGQTFSLTIGNVFDADGPPIPNLATFQVTWQVELRPDTEPGVFTDILDPALGATFTGPTFTPLPGMELEGLRIRARASFTDATGLREVVVSAPSIGLAAQSVIPNPMTPGIDFAFGTLGNDTIDALAGDDDVFGFAGNDTFIDNLGNDIYNGGLDTDVVVFNGNRADFVIEITPAGVIEVVANGEEDAVIGIELLRFADGLFQIQFDANGDPVLDVDGNVLITPVTEAPADAINDTATTVFATPVTLNVLANDTGADAGQVLSITQVDGQAIAEGGAAVAVANGNGSIVMTAGRLVFTPTVGFAGVAQFTYTMTDGAGADTATVQVTVNADTPPAIGVGSAFGSGVPTSTIIIPENMTAATVLFDMNASDLQPGTLTFSLVGADAGRFDINPTTGVITFKASPDFEIPTDAGTDNVYNFSAVVTDGSNLSASQALTVNVANANDAPTGTLRMNRLNTAIGLVLVNNLIQDVDGIGANFRLFWEALGSAAANFVEFAPGSDLTQVQIAANQDSIIQGVATWTDGGGTAERLTSVDIARVGTIAGDDVINGDGRNEHIFGLAGNDTLNGGDGNDSLDGGAGADVLNAGAGNDVVFADNLDTGIDGGTGIDQVNFVSTANFINPVFVNNVEVVFGSSANDYIIVGTASQGVEMHGGDGNDMLSGGAFGDTIFGDAGRDFLFGGGGDDTIHGGAGDDVLRGDAGTDTLIGGDGDDTYNIDTADTIVETATGGTADTVYATFNYTLHDNVERAVAISTGVQSLTGNSSDNWLLGNSATNTLQGGEGADLLYGYGGDDYLIGDAGVDSLIGGIGNDVYVVQDELDVIFENADEGLDVVITSADHSLDANVEYIHSTGAGNINLTGNELHNGIYGNAGNNVLFGGAGSDILSGGTGFDIAEYDGLASLYQIAMQTDGWVRVTDNRGPAGDSDLLQGIERIRFRGDGIEIDF